MRVREHNAKTPSAKTGFLATLRAFLPCPGSGAPSLALSRPPGRLALAASLALAATLAFGASPAAASQPHAFGSPGSAAPREFA